MNFEVLVQLLVCILMFGPIRTDQVEADHVNHVKMHYHKTSHRKMYMNGGDVGNITKCDNGR